jgi:hypothetical protein
MTVEIHRVEDSIALGFDPDSDSFDGPPAPVSETPAEQAVLEAKYQAPARTAEDGLGVEDYGYGPGLESSYWVAGEMAPLNAESEVG